MKNKKVIIILTSMILLIGGILSISQIYNKSKNKHIPKRNNLAIMIKNESGEYESSDAIPKGNYVLNEEKTICENGGKVVSYNNSTGQIGFSFLGSDRCSLYFDKIIDNEKPVISNLSVNDKTIIAILTDNVELSGYGISTSNSVEPTSWTSISGTSYNLTINITTEGTYYLWVKDSSGNKTVSDVIDLEKKGYQTILINNGGGATTVDAAINYIKGKGTPNFANTATTNEGMYAAEDDLGTSYYFRGAVNNNWVKFGKDSSNKDMYWRIIRINGDGSIRMIYSGTTAPTSNTATVMTGTGTQINSKSYVFNSDYVNSAYVGYMYEVGQQHGTSNSSAIKNTIDTWYKTTTLETDTTIKKLISDQIFCNDRSLTSASVINYYGAYTRIKTKNSPILKCPIESDKFTKSVAIGNGKLIYPVGLITADEISMAGAKYYDEKNTSYYLYTNQNYWTESPYSFNGSLGADDPAYAFEFTVSYVGYLSDGHVFDSFGVRPVISLSSSVKLSGDGTYNNVYTVS